MTRARSAIDLLEEAVALLRSAPLETILTYLVGAVPLTLGFLFFLVDMNRSPYASEHLPWASLGLAVLYVWKNSWQALFMARLYHGVSPDEERAGSPWRAIFMQSSLQPLGLLIPLPFPWITAFFRNAALYAGLGRTDAVAAARRQAVKATGQNWAVLAILTLGALLLFVNVLIAIVFLPQLGRSLLGIEGDLVRLGNSILNVTTLGVALAVTWFAVDPLLDAVYVLRCFYGESIASGADLRAALKRATAVVAMILVMITGAHAQTIDQKQLDQAIDQVVHQREFTWRSPHPSGPEPDGKWVGWYRSSVKMIVNAWNWLMTKLREWFSPPEQHGVGKDSPLTRKTMVALIAVNVALIAGGLIFFLLRKRKRTVLADPVVAAAPAVNLSDESLTADRLPEKEWLALADEWMAKGDFRFALRATYLAGLNYLSSRELVALRRWKSGLDYRRELARRARSKPDLPASFAEGQAIFEQGWYGRHTVDREMAESLASLLNQMRRHAQ